jgi:hypothetical protein
MHLPHLKHRDQPLYPLRTGDSRRGIGIDNIEQDPPLANGLDSPSGTQSSSQIRGEFESVLDEFDRATEIHPCDCNGYISRARARYQKGDTGCEEDYRAAFLLDARLAASEIVRGLEADILDDVAYVLVNCRKRLRLDTQDVVARARRGLTLLLLHQDLEAFHDLQQVFLQSPAWRPFLRLLVNEAKQRRVSISPRIARS